MLPTYEIQDNQNINMRINLNMAEQQYRIQQKNNNDNGLQKGNRTIVGSMGVNYIIYAWIPFILFSPLYTYYMAVSKGQEHKYPHPTITDTACHYPQDIQFRLVMGSAATFVSYIYHVMFKWIKYQKKRTQYPGPIYGWLYYPSLVSVWGYMAAMATIDGGWYPDLHTQGAVFFFVFLFLIVISQTIVLRDMHKWDSTVLTPSSYVMKSILMVYVAIVWLFCLYGVVTHPSGFGDDENVYIVILEYNTVYVCLFWIFSFRADWKDVHLTFTRIQQSEIPSQRDL